MRGVWIFSNIVASQKLTHQVKGRVANLLIKLHLYVQLQKLLVIIYILSWTGL